MAKSLKSKGRRTAASSVVALLLALALPACGSAQPPDQRHGQQRGVGLKQIGRFESPGLRHRRARVSQAALRRRAGRDGAGAAQRAQARPPVPRHPRPDLLRRRARPALDRLPPRLQAAAVASTSTTPTPRATSGSTSSNAGARREPRGAPAAQWSQIPHPVNANHNGGQLQFLGNFLYFGTGDGGSGGDPPNNAQNPHKPARQAAADRPARRAPRQAARSTATACATRSASPSTG